MVRGWKRIAALLMLLSFCLSLAACGAKAPPVSPQIPPEESGEAPPVVLPEPEPEAEPVPEPETEPEPEPEPEPAWEWQYDTPESQGMSPSALASLHAALEPTEVRAAVVIRHDRIVDEYFKEGYDETSIFTLQSCSKSVTSAIFGIAVDMGYIESVDAPISEYFPQLLESGSEYKKQITIWHLLTHTSGLDISDTADWEQWRSSENWVDFALSRPAVYKPGTVFSYTTAGTHLLCAIFQQATGRTLYDFGREYLFEPLGMDSVTCGTDAQGISDGGNGFAMNVCDMAKLGRLFLNKGAWEGRQIISEEWAEASTTLQFKRSSGSADYGYQWWVRTFGEEKYPAFFAQGHWGQYIFVVPELELIVVFTSFHDGSSSMYWQFVNDIVAACE